MDLLRLLMSSIVISGALIVAVVGLFSAPWQLLLAILLSGLWGTRWLMQENQRRSFADEFPSIELSSFDSHFSSKP